MATRGPLLTGAIARALGAGANQRLANIIEGAQLGYGTNMPMFPAATPQVFPPTTIIVIRTPAFYDGSGDENTYMRRYLKAIIESHAKTVSGIDFGYTLSTDEGPAGHDGQNRKVPTKTRRSEVSPSITFNELIGALGWRVFRKWMFDIQHADSPYGRAVSARTPRMSSDYAMDLMLVQFDPTGLPENIMNAAYLTDVFPTDIGQFGYERNIAQSRAVERTIQFAATVLDNDAVLEGARILTQTLSAAMVDFNKLNRRMPIIGRSVRELLTLHGGIPDSGLAFEATRAEGIAADVP